MNSRRVAKALLLLASLAVAVASVEGVLRWMAPSSPFSSAYPFYPNRVRILHVARDGRQEVVRHSTNRWGFRGDEPPEPWTRCRTILAVGGSTTQCYYLDDAATWTQRLQQRLQTPEHCVWVGNAGLDGHSTFGHLQVMKDVVSKVRPEVVLFLTGVNDLSIALSGEGARFDKRGDWRWRLFRDSRLFQYLYVWKLVHVNKVHRVEDAKREYIPQPFNGQDPSTNDLSSLVDLATYRANIKGLIAESRQIGAEPVFLTQPILWSDTPQWRKVYGSVYWATQKAPVSAAFFARLMDLYNETLLETCRAEHVRCFDLAKALPKKRAYYDDFVHFSAEGAAAVAEAVGGYLRFSELQ